jgi:hypothetical protein
MFAQASDQVDRAAEEVSAGFGGSGIHQFEFEGESVGLATAFGGGVVFARQHVARTA